MNLPLNFSLGHYWQQFALILRAIGMALVIFSPKAYADTIGSNIGVFHPSESIVRSVYETEPLHFEIRYAKEIGNGLHLAASPIFYRMESQVKDLESYTNFYILNLGFNQTVGGYGGINPFIGAGIGYVWLASKQENESKESSLQENDRGSYGTYWEIGLNFPSGLGDDIGLQAKLMEQYIDYTLFGNINIGGKVISIGMHYKFGATR